MSYTLEANHRGVPASLLDLPDISAVKISASRKFLLRQAQRGAVLPDRWPNV